MRTRVAVVLLVVAVMWTATAAQSRLRLRWRLGTAASVAKDGWWIRINFQGTEATELQIEFGPNPKDLPGQDSWKSGGPTEMALPEVLSAQKAIHLKLTSTPASAEASVCVFFQQQGVALMQFSGSDGKQLNANQKDTSCTP